MGTFVPSEEFPAIVVDNGSSTCRAGLAGEDIPSCIFSSVVGRRKNILGKDELFVGNSLQEERELLALTYPIEHGIVVNWEDMKKIWDYAFYSKLSVIPQEHPILISEPPLNPMGNREKMAEVLFETYRAPAIFIANQAMLAKHSCGLSRCMMLTVGDGCTHAVPIVDGRILCQAIRRLDFGGRDLTRHLQKLLMQQGYSFTTSYELEIVRDLKERYCLISDGDESIKTGPINAKQTCQLSDKTTIEVDSKIFRCPEIMFQPGGDFYNGKTIIDLISDSVEDTDLDLRVDLIYNICLCGSTTYLPGFPQRLKKEVLKISAKKNPMMRIFTVPKNQPYRWMGGAFLASVHDHIWISSSQYDECGPSVVNSLCYGE